MAGKSVLAAGQFGHATPGGQWSRGRGHSEERQNIPQSEFRKMGQRQSAAALGDVGQGIGSVVSEGCSIGQTAYTHGIENNQDHAMDFDFGHPPT